VAEPMRTSLCLSLLSFRAASTILLALLGSSCWPNNVFDRECALTLTRLLLFSMSSVIHERSIPATASLVLVRQHQLRAQSYGTLPQISAPVTDQALTSTSTQLNLYHMKTRREE
jgi:hypothetical protein